MLIALLKLCKEIKNYMHFFIDHTKLTAQTAAQAYGPVFTFETAQYNVTSQLNLSDNAKAFACQDAMMLVISIDPLSTLVNLILKPIAGSGKDFPAIKYYVYRGLLKSSFIDNSDLVTPKSIVSPPLTSD